MLDFFVIGDVLVDRIITITDSSIVGSIDTTKHTVVLPFPTKLHLDQPVESYLGGNAYTAARVLVHLGLETGIYTVIGEDQESESIMTGIKNAGIEHSNVVIEKGAKANSSVIINIAGDRVIFSHHHDREYKLSNMPETKYVYLTSLGENDKPLFDQLLEAKERINFQLIFSPGTRQLNENFSDIKDILAATDILILNKEEAKKLSRLHSQSNENLLTGLHRLGPKIVIMTRSNHGSIAYNGNEFIKVGALPVDVVEVTGAGDTYSSTLAGALLKGKDLRTAMEWGAINAGNAVRYIGATTGILKLSELETEHERLKDKLVYTEPAITHNPEDKFIESGDTDI